MTYENDVSHIGKDERVCCYYCQRDNDHTEYGHGQAFLANPGHSPCDGNANYICRRHLDFDAVVYEPFPEQAVIADNQTKGE